MRRFIALVPCIAFLSFACGAPAGPDEGKKDDGKTSYIPDFTDACLNETDEPWLTGKQDGDLTGREVAREGARQCGPACMNAKNAGDCVVDCMIKRKNVTLSENCSACYGAITMCSVERCFAPCSMDAASEDCKSCQREKGCQDIFDTCSGLEDDGG